MDVANSKDYLGVQITQNTTIIITMPENKNIPKDGVF